MLNIFLINNFFEKSSIFRENREKLFSSTFDDFLKKGGVLLQKLRQLFLSQMRYGIFYYLAAFSKKVVFSEKMTKTVSGGQVSFEEKGASGDKNKYYFF